MAVPHRRRDMLRCRSRVRVAAVFFLATCGFLSLWRMRLGLGEMGGTSGFSLEATVTAATDSDDVPPFVCPRCDDLFSKLSPNGKQNEYSREQETRIQLRGEPKVRAEKS